MSDLANRLVTAAEKALVQSIIDNVPPNLAPTLPPGSTATTLAQAAATAVLMALAESGQVAWAESLAGLAEVIEKGEQA